MGKPSHPQAMQSVPTEGVHIEIASGTQDSRRTKLLHQQRENKSPASNAINSNSFVCTHRIGTENARLPQNNTFASTKGNQVSHKHCNKFQKIPNKEPSKTVNEHQHRETKSPTSSAYGPTDGVHIEQATGTQDSRRTTHLQPQREIESPTSSAINS